MNDNIKEIAEQAGIRTNLDTDFYVKKDMNKWASYFSERLAVLIIPECLSKCWYDCRPKEIANNIKQHFGIK